MIVNGIDLSLLAHASPKINAPETVPGRVVHIDADFLAYMVAWDDKKSLDDMKHNAKESIETIRLMSGAATTMLHLTPKGSDKGGRYDIALLKAYQTNREKVKPKYLNVIREWMESALGAVMHYTAEADDGMAMAQYAAIAAGHRELSIIASKDKDLTMVPGLQLNWDTGEITDTADNDFGHIYVCDKTKTKKVRGRGWKYFWAQMLMGDAADTISGLPKVCDPAFTNGKPKLCGPMMAIQILADCNTNKEAYERVRGLFEYYEQWHKSMDLEGFKNYRCGTPIPWQEAFISEAKLLWMRRNHNHDDVIFWMKETCL